MLTSFAAVSVLLWAGPQVTTSAPVAVVVVTNRTAAAKSLLRVPLARVAEEAQKLGMDAKADGTELVCVDRSLLTSQYEEALDGILASVRKKPIPCIVKASDLGDPGLISQLLSSSGMVPPGIAKRAEKTPELQVTIDLRLNVEVSGGDRKSHSGAIWLGGKLDPDKQAVPGLTYSDPADAKGRNDAENPEVAAGAAERDAIVVYVRGASPFPGELERLQSKGFDRYQNLREEAREERRKRVEVFFSQVLGSTLSQQKEARLASLDPAQQDAFSAGVGLDYIQLGFKSREEATNYLSDATLKVSKPRMMVFVTVRRSSNVTESYGFPIVP